MSLLWLLIPGGIIFLYCLAIVILHTCVYKSFDEKVDVQNKSILITGGTSGIGAVTTKQLYLRGMKVTFTGRQIKNAEELVDDLKKTLKDCKLIHLAILIIFRHPKGRIPIQGRRRAKTLRS